jgi:hypothetical protein
MRIKLLIIAVGALLFFGCEDGNRVNKMERGAIYKTGLPALKIDTGNQPVVSRDVWLTKMPYVVYVYDSDKDEFEESVSGLTDIKGRGHSTWAMPKKPYAIKLTKIQPITDRKDQSHKRWNLLANYSDKTLLRTDVAFYMGNEIFDKMAWAPHSKQVDFYLNNEYLGLYQLTEAIEIAENRVNLTGNGYILEIDTHILEELSGDFYFNTKKGLTFVCSKLGKNLEEAIENNPDGGKSIYDKIRADVQQLEDAIFAFNFTDPIEGYRNYLDVDSFIDWYLVNEITKNHDAAFVSSVYMHRELNGDKFVMGPLWDFDLALGNYGETDSKDPEGFHIKNVEWVKRLFEDPWFREQVKKRWIETKGKVDALYVNEGYIDTQVERLSKAVDLNFQRWLILHEYVWPNPVVTGSYDKEIANLKDWFGKRMTWLDGAIKGL